jgi:isohexenylglutaconyl-CoA hydratase
MSALPDTRLTELQLDGGWLTVWLNRPDAANALSGELVAELMAVLSAVADDRGVRGITLRGRGGVFCAGGDLKGFKASLQDPDRAADGIAEASRRAGALFARLDTMPQVVVMLVEGAAMAGGLGMVCAGDVVAVTADARFALTETRLGIPPAQIAPLVVRRIGLAAARRIMLTGAQFRGEEARALGIADYVAESVAELELLEADIRAAVLRCAPGANAVTKELVLAAGQLAPEAMQEVAARRFAECLLGEEGREGIASFLEKRKPRWAP